MKQNFLFGIVVICCITSACVRNNQWMQRHYLPAKGWDYTDAKSFSFAVKDTSTKYKINLLMQHSEAYAWSNIWCKMIVQDPSGKKDTTTLEVPLAMPSGQWMGRSANGLVEHTADLMPNAGTLSFEMKGNYTFTILQDMRVNPLKEITYVGLQVEALETQSKK
jgi:gliding motility-associated lipoprotein GldH